MKKIIFYIGFFLAFLLIFFMIGEICFRLSGNKSESYLFDIVQKKKDYLIKPGSVIHKTSSIEGEFDFTAHINHFGYRGKDFENPKNPKNVRIFAVGDLFTFGVGAQDSQTIPFLIEQNLKKENPNIEVVNAGIGHSSPIQHYVNLKNIHLKYKPDMVLLLFDLTDLWDDWHWERAAIKDKAGEIVDFNLMFVDGKRDWWRTFVSYSAFGKWINNKIVRSFKKIQLLGFKRYMTLAMQGKRAKAEIINAENTKKEDQIEYDGFLFMRGREKKDLIDENWKRTEEYLDKIKDLCDKNGIPLMIVVYPHGIYVGEHQWAKGRETWGFEDGKIYRDYYAFEVLEDYAYRRSMPFLNSLDSFLGAEPKKYFYDWDGHMTPDGYEVVAHSILSSHKFQSMLISAEEKKGNNVR